MNYQLVQSKKNSTEIADKSIPTIGTWAHACGHSSFEVCHFDLRAMKNADKNFIIIIIIMVIIVVGAPLLHTYRPLPIYFSIHLSKHIHIYIYLFIHWIYILINQVINIYMGLKLNEQSVSAGILPFHSRNAFIHLIGNTVSYGRISTHFSPISIIPNWWFRSNYFVLSLLNTNQMQLIYLK